MIGIVSFLSLLVTALVVAFFARRILGAPVGWPRSVLIGLIMVSLLGNMLPGLAQTIGLVDASGQVSQPAVAGVMLGLVVAWAFFLSIAALVLGATGVGADRTGTAGVSGQPAFRSIRRD
jgi:ubiquinone biosynthesis protein